MEKPPNFAEAALVAEITQWHTLCINAEIRKSMGANESRDEFG
jgi:hypothetical protein